MLLPLYASVRRRNLERIPDPLGVPIGQSEIWTGLYRDRLPGEPGVSVYLLDHEAFFMRAGVYGTPDQPAFRDNIARFATLSRAAFQFCRKMQWIPDIIHANDWPTALTPVYQKTIERGSVFGNTATVFTIHNLGYQGLFDIAQLSEVGLPPSAVNEAGLIDAGLLNLLRGGLLTADGLATVSPRYAEEIQQPGAGFGLDNILRDRRAELRGVLNGIDYSIWNPETDPLLPRKFSAQDLRGKAGCKSALQSELGLPIDPAVPLFGMVSRLVRQKGLRELVEENRGALEHLLGEQDLQIVVLGTGERWAERGLSRLAARFPNLRVILDFNNALAHRIEAASDFFLMPSRYEPCGLNQMYSLRYGTIPIVNPTGGLADSVRDLSEDLSTGNGIYLPEMSPEGIIAAVRRALELFRRGPDALSAVRSRGMAERFSWDEAAAQYLEVYEGALGRLTDRKRSRRSLLRRF